MKKLILKKMTNFRSLALIGILVLAVATVGCEDEADVYTPSSEENELKSGKSTKGDKSIAGLVVAANMADEPEFTLLFGALEHAGLTSVFAGKDQYTVFAPTDQAFIDLVVALSPLPPVEEDETVFDAIDKKLGEGTVKKVLKYHVTEGRRSANSVLAKGKNMKTIETLLEQSFKVDSNGMIYTSSMDVAAASIVTETPGATFNVSASNGIIHVITSVLLPPQ